MTASFFQELQTELHLGVSQKGHPFRYFTFATVGLDRMARLRTVVLREVSEDLAITFYSDKRSKKITHIKENPKVSMLFYHPEKMIQLKLEGIASIITDTDLLSTYWKNIPSSAQKEYTINKPPGSTISRPETISYLKDENHFCAVTMTPFKIEYLQLQNPHHIRVRYSKEASRWNGEFLVP